MQPVPARLLHTVGKIVPVVRIDLLNRELGRNVIARRPCRNQRQDDIARSQGSVSVGLFGKLEDFLAELGCVHVHVSVVDFEALEDAVED